MSVIHRELDLAANLQTIPMFANSRMTEDTQTGTDPHTKVQRILDRGFVFCFAIAGVSAVRAALSYQDVLALAAWLAGSAYFLTAPSALRKGVENRRIMIGLLSVLLVVTSIGGALELATGSMSIHGIVSLATIILASPLVVIFGYNQQVVYRLRSFREIAEK